MAQPVLTLDLPSMFRLRAGRLSAIVEWKTGETDISDQESRGGTPNVACFTRELRRARVRWSQPDVETEGAGAGVGANLIGWKERTHQSNHDV